MSTKQENTSETMFFWLVLSNINRYGLITAKQIKEPYYLHVVILDKKIATQNPWVGGEYRTAFSS